MYISIRLFTVLMCPHITCATFPSSSGTFLPNCTAITSGRAIKTCVALFSKHLRFLSKTICKTFLHILFSSFCYLIRCICDLIIQQIRSTFYSTYYSLRFRGNFLSIYSFLYKVILQPFLVTIINCLCTLLSKFDSATNLRMSASYEEENDSLECTDQDQSINQMSLITSS